MRTFNVGRKTFALGLALIVLLVLERSGAVLAQTSGEDFLKSGAAKYDKGDWDGAISDYTKALEIDPKLAAACNWRGLVRQAKGDWEGAIVDFTHALEIDPKMASAYKNRAHAYYVSRDWIRALADSRHLGELDA